MIAKGYISSRSFMGERVPQSVQNLVIRDYCKSNHLIFELSSTEYAMNESYYVLRQLLLGKKYKCIIFYSLFQLPEDSFIRTEIVKKFIKKKKKLIFALENIKIQKILDLQNLENIWHVKKILKYCPSTQEIKGLYNV